MAHKLTKHSSFDYTIDYRKLDFRKNPEHYQIGRGEQGVLLVEPYKSELLPFWRFATPQAARKSANAIYKIFLQYGESSDFVGMDMARKFLQMGFTRARRYANHASGRKYAKDGSRLPIQADKNKAISAEIFRKKWESARTDPLYLQMKKAHREKQASNPKSPLKRGVR